MSWRLISALGTSRVGGAPRVRGTVIGVPLQGPPGPQGPAGPTGPSGGAGFDRVADVTLGGHRCVRATSASGVDYADPGTPAHRDSVLGITANAAVAGDPVDVIVSGPMSDGSWAWTPGQPIYAGPSGALTQTPPVAGWLRVLGFASSPTSIVVQLLPPIVLL